MHRSTEARKNGGIEALADAMRALKNVFIEKLYVNQKRDFAALQKHENRIRRFVVSFFMSQARH